MFTMGDPATPTAADRAETLALCKAIVRAVREDESFPPEIEFGFPNREQRQRFDEWIVRMAQEVTLLAEQLAEVMKARDEACDLAVEWMSDGWRDDRASHQRIAALRKVGV